MGISPEGWAFIRLVDFDMLDVRFETRAKQLSRQDARKIETTLYETVPENLSQELVEHLSTTRNIEYDEKSRIGLKNLIVRCLEKELRWLEPVIQNRSNSTIPELTNSSGGGGTSSNSSHIAETADSNGRSALIQDFTDGELDLIAFPSTAELEKTATIDRADWTDTYPMTPDGLTYQMTTNPTVLQPLSLNQTQLSHINMSNSWQGEAPLPSTAYPFQTLEPDTQQTHLSSAAFATGGFVQDQPPSTPLHQQQMSMQDWEDAITHSGSMDLTSGLNPPDPAAPETKKKRGVRFFLGRLKR
jgi:hypothetical protein